MKKTIIYAFLISFLMTVVNLCFPSDSVKLHLVSYLDNGSGEFTVISQWDEGSYLLKLGVELNIDKAKVIFIEDLNSDKVFCSRPYPYYQLTYLRSSSTFETGNLMVMTPRPCIDLIARLKLIVLDENKRIYTDTLVFIIKPYYDVN